MQKQRSMKHFIYSISNEYSAKILGVFLNLFLSRYLLTKLFENVKVIDIFVIMQTDIKEQERE